jgi:hypothetical protein
VQAPTGPEKAAEILTDLIPPEQWTVYAEFLAAAAARGLRVAVGGGLAVSACAAYVRNTKDMDLFVLEKESGELIELSRELGFEEYLEVTYDPTWSYRCSRDGYIIDFLWRMLNGKASVDETWVTKGWDLQVRGVPFKLIPVEELVLAKLYILRRDRSDWPDIMSLLFAHGTGLDWERMFLHLDEDRTVLGSVVSLLRWVCPGRTSRFPEWIWAPMGLLPPTESEPEVHRERAALLKAEHLFGDLP